MQAKTGLAEAFDINTLPGGFAEDPFPVYRALLEDAPLKRFPDGSVMLSRYEDLDRVYRDTKTFSSDKKVEFLPKFGRTPLYEHHTTSLVFNDSPLHSRVRKIMMGALTPKAIAAMEPRLIALVDRLLDRIAEKGDVELIEDFAAAIPLEVIGNLFVMPHEDRGPLRDWSLSILGALEPVLTTGQLERGNRAVTDFKAYLGDLAAERKAHPGDPATDVLTRLIAGNDGELLSDTELLQNCIFILNAGHETTTNLIGSALHELTQWPGERRRLLDDPGMIDTAVDEFLRFQSPNQFGNRMAVEPSSFHGETIEPGTRIHLAIGAANRDPRQFADPDRLDLSRKPNRHLAFAQGPHLCAGFSLARMEGRIAISRFLRRFPAFELSGAPRRTGRVRFRGFASLPARVA
jgi:cytochrome P450